jgi:hypothetical protein
MKRGTPKDLTQLIKAAEHQGWEVTISNSGHLRWVSPTGGIVFSSRTPSDRRVIPRIKQDLRMRGFIELRKK